MKWNGTTLYSVDVFLFWNWRTNYGNGEHISHFASLEMESHWRDTQTTSIRTERKGLSGYCRFHFTHTHTRWWYRRPIQHLMAAQPIKSGFVTKRTICAFSRLLMGKWMHLCIRCIGCWFPVPTPQWCVVDRWPGHWSKLTSVSDRHRVLYGGSNRSNWSTRMLKSHIVLYCNSSSAQYNIRLIELLARCS